MSYALADAVSFSPSFRGIASTSEGQVMAAYELAQLNIGICKRPMDNTVMADFAANLQRINALADGAPGFVWRLQTEAGDATPIRLLDDENLLLKLPVCRG